MPLETMYYRIIGGQRFLVGTNMVKGDKVLVFHKKRRKGYRKLNGHRQQFTELTITEVVA
jgi:large subunit ribosomal protein L21